MPREQKETPKPKPTTQQHLGSRNPSHVGVAEPGAGNKAEGNKKKPDMVPPADG
jgi:hypothetical protein